jgi:hypothetical protein
VVALAGGEEEAAFCGDSGPVRVEGRLDSARDLERVQVYDVEVVALAAADVPLDGAAGLLAVGGRGWRQGGQGQRQGERERLPGS